MGMCCEKKMVGWRNVWSWGYKQTKEDLERLYVRTVKLVNWTKRMPWIVVNGGSWQRTSDDQRPLNGCVWCVCSTGLPGCASTRKVKPIWSKRQWLAVASAGLYASLHLTSENHTSTPPLSFCRPDACPATQPTASKQWRQLKQSYNCYYIHTLTCDLL